MDQVPQSWQESLNLGLTYAVAQFSTFLPRLLGAVVILVVGILVAKIVRKVVCSTLETFRVSKIVEHTPLEVFLKNAELGTRVEEGISKIFYWLVIFIVMYTAVSVLGLTPLSLVMDKILSYIPHIFSAFLIFLFGVLLAGVVESVVKGTLRGFDVTTVRLFAKVASYMVVIVSTLAAVAELGIASQFITILFMGVVFSFSLGSALAQGLGGQEIVKNILGEWYKRSKE
jgi:hypothetical protein